MAIWRMGWLTDRDQLAEAIQSCKEMLAWNPDDNQGVRYTLGAILANTGRHADELALCERFPDEGGALEFHRVFALHALERKGDALSLLAEAHKRSPKVLKFLLADDPRQPKPDRYSVVIGGDFEAWLYRQALHAAWARSCLPSLKRLG